MKRGSGMLIGPGGRPANLYVLYGESTRLSVFRILCTLSSPRANFSVGSACSAMPIRSLLRYTPAIRGASVICMVSACTMEASVAVSVIESPFAFAFAFRSSVQNASCSFRMRSMNCSGVVVHQNSYVLGMNRLMKLSLSRPAFSCCSGSLKARRKPIESVSR